MRKIFKYTIPLRAPGETTIQIPAGAKLLHFGEDPAWNPCIWAAVDPSAEKVDLPVLIAFTGDAVACNGEDAKVPWHYLGTYVMTHDQLVLHCFVKWSV